MAHESHGVMSTIILLAEDDELAAAWAIGALQESAWLTGLEVHRTSTLAQTLAACAHQAPDLLILDLKLADMLSGFSTFSSIHRAYPEVPVFIWSVLIGGQEGSFLIQEGAAHCLAKPNLAEPDALSRERFVEAVLSSLAQAQIRRDLVSRAMPQQFSAEIHRELIVLSDRVSILEQRWPQVQQWVDQRLKLIESTLGDFRGETAEEFGSLRALLSLTTERIRGRYDLVGKLLVSLLGLGGILASAWAAMRWR